MKHRPLIPMGSITGKPTKEQLHETLASYLSAGIDQFMIYPRSGLEVPYMSDEWLDICEHIITYAADHDMAIWIYDEYNWPSGKCAGQVVLENANFAAQKLSVFKDTEVSGEPAIISECRNYYWSVSSSPRFADLLNPAAVDCFIELTHEKYAKRFSQYFGTVIKGFFTDEPSPVYSTTHSRINDACLELPYYSGLEEDYNASTGRNFREDIENYLDGDSPEGLFSTYSKLYGQRFKMAYMDKLTDWCQAHNLEFTGHLMDEVHPDKSIRCSGDPIQTMNAFSMPGIDEIFTHTDPESIEWFTLKTVENALVAKNKTGMVELFALGSCSMTHAKMRQMIWLVALHKISHYVTAVSSMDSRANYKKKPFYYNPLSQTQPWFEAFKELGDEAAIAAKYAAKQADFQLAVRFPQTLLAEQAKFCNDDAKCDYVGLLRELNKAQWQTLMIAEDDSNTSSYQAILSVTSKGLTEERSGTTFEDMAEAIKWLEINMTRKVSVVDSANNLAENVLVKSYQDGSVCVLALGDKPGRNLVLKTEGEDIPFTLAKQGCFLHEGAREDTEPCNLLELPEQGCSYELHNQNTYRLVFNAEGFCEVNVLADLANVTIATRQYGDAVKLKLNGQAVESMSPSVNLPKGLKELYEETASMTLPKGKHRLELMGKYEDFPYLPLAFIIGEFAVEADQTLRQLSSEVDLVNFQSQGLKEYTGKISFTTTANLVDISHLKLNSQELATELFINGESLGHNLWEPFIWQIPENLRNENAHIEIQISTSIGPLFGTLSNEMSTIFPANGWLEKYWPNDVT